MRVVVGQRLQARLHVLDAGDVEALRQRRGGFGDVNGAAARGTCRGGEGALQGVKIISKPSRRMYIKGAEIRPVRSGHGIAIISTSKGIMSSKDAWKQKLGGEILCEVW